MVRVVARLAVLLVLIAAWVAPSVQAAETVVDNADQGLRRSGDWVSSNATPGFYGGDYLYHVAGDGSASVFWPFPAANPAGRYEVFVRWNSGPNRADDASYVVSFAGGSSSVSANQKQGGGDWHSLGVFAFSPAGDLGVSLSDKADGVVIADAVRFVGPVDAPADASTTATPAATAAGTPASTPAATPAPTPAPTSAPTAGPTSAAAVWAVTLNAADLHAGPDAGTDTLAHLPQYSYLQVLGYQDAWAYVYNPRARGTAYLRSDMLGPSDPPPAWVTADPPPLEALDQVGRSVGSAPVAFYPVDDPFAYTSRLGHNAPIHVRGRVHSADGSVWYRVDQGFLKASSVRLPTAPTRTFSGRWVDADLSEPAMVTAYEGDRIVMTTLAIKGKVATETPTGVFSIGRRVEDETMDSDTIGIPHDGPGGYHLEHVKYTQYFTSDGASLHYNYWSSNWGYAGSHGCLGLPLDVSAFLWDWADLGTPVVIR